jgi:glucokinase
MPPALKLLAYDIGGTWIRRARVHQDGRLSRHKKWSTPTKETHAEINPHEVPDVMLREIVESIPTPKPDAIGISWAGPVNPTNGEILKGPNIWDPSIQNIPLAAQIQKATGIPTTLVNDMTAAALRERHTGLAQGASSFRIITVSSGIGSKLVIDGNVILGKTGTAGEIGHAVVDPQSNIKCGCGGYGHLESLASGNAAKRIAQEMARLNKASFKKSILYQMTDGKPEQVNNELISTAAEQGDPFTMEVLKKVNNPMALKISQLWADYDVDKILIIGGFALGVGTPYFETLRSQVQKAGLFGVDRTDRAFVDNLIVPGSADDNSGIIGAALAARNMLQQAA